MTRILVVTSLYPPHHLGGAELSCFDVVTRLADRGHEIEVLCADARLPGVADPPSETNVHRRLGVYLRDGEPWSPPLRERLAIERRNQRTLAEALDRFRPDVASVWHMGAMSLGLLTTLTRRGVPIVYAACDEWPAYETKLDAWARLWWGNRARRVAGRVAESLLGVPSVVEDIGGSGAYLWVSRQTWERVLAHSPWRYPRSTVVYSGIDTRAFPVRGPAPRPWRWRIMYAGRLDVRKGVDTAVRALAHLPVEARLRLCGRGVGGEQERLVGVAEQVGVRDRITFEELTRDELAEAYRDSDVLVFPSIWEEPFGLVPVEAMACATPVVATGTGGSAEFLFDGDNCVLFPAGDDRALAAAVCRLADDTVLRERVVAGGLATAAQLDAARLTDVFESWLRAAAARYPDGPPPDRGPVRMPSDA